MDESKQTGFNHEKLYRSKVNKTFAGVCGGMAEFFNIDPLIVRVGWVFTTLFAGAGIVAYIIAIFIIPENPEQHHSDRKRVISPESSKQWGIILIVIGAIFLLGQTGLVDYFYLRHFHWQTFLAILLVAFGIYLIVNKSKNIEIEGSLGTEKKNQENTTEAGFIRIPAGKMIGGVCTGISTYFNIDVTIIRLIWILATLASGGLPIVAYLATMLIFPYSSETSHYESSGGKP